MNGALYPDDFPEEPVAGITDDEVENFLASIGKGERPMNDELHFADLDEWMAGKVTRCGNCHVRNDGTVVFCGWHETSFAASKYVKRIVDGPMSQTQETQG